MGISKWAKDEATKKMHDVEAQKAKAITTGKVVKPFEQPKAAKKSTDTVGKEVKTTTDTTTDKVKKPVVNVPEKRVQEPESSNDFNFDF